MVNEAVNDTAFFHRYILKEIEHSSPLAENEQLIYLKYKN